MIICDGEESECVTDICFASKKKIIKAVSMTLQTLLLCGLFLLHIHLPTLEKQTYKPHHHYQHQMWKLRGEGKEIQHQQPENQEHGMDWAVVSGKLEATT